MTQKFSKNLRLRAAMLVALLCAGFCGAWGETVTLTQSTLGLTGSYTSNTEKTIAGITYVYSDLMKSNDNIQAKASSGTIYNKTAFPGNITSVAITHSGTARPTTIYGSSDGKNWTQISTSNGSITGNFSNYEFKYFKITRGSNAAYWTQIVINYSTTSICATPTFNPAAGTYTSAQSVSIGCNTSGATIYYTTNGNAPTTSSDVYSSAINVSETTTIKAMAVKEGYTTSAIATAAYIIKTDPALAFSAEAASATIGQAFTAPTLTNTHNVNVTWTSSKTGVATVANDGTINLISEGTTTITASFDGDNNDNYISSTASYTLTVTDPNKITLWSENFESYSANEVPYGGTYGYVCTDGGSATKIFTDGLAGGTNPRELLVGKNGGSFKAIVPLNNALGNLKLTFKTNAKSMTVSTNTNGIGIDGTASFSSAGTHTVIFTNVTTTMTSITIVFTAINSDNVRLDDIELIGHAEAFAVAAPTFSPNPGSYYGAQSVELNCATEEATIYYRFNETDEWTEYSNAIYVEHTTTIYAKAVNGSDESTISTGTYNITEKNDVVFNITDKELVYGNPYSVSKSTSGDPDVKTDGYVSLESSNTSVATVSGFVITPVAVGETTITITATEGENYKPGTTTFTLNVVAPEGLATAIPNTAANIFEEHFNAANGSGPSGDTWTGIQANADFQADNEDWTSTGAMHSGDGCAKFGKSGENGNGTTPAIAFDGTTTYTLTFRAGAWNDDNTTLELTCDDENAVIGTESFTMENNAWSEYTTTVKAAAGSKLTFKSTGISYGRFFLDDVVVTNPNAEAPTIPVTLNSSGYATFCSLYPLDFTNATDYSAWIVTGVNGSDITFVQLTGSVKGGTGILLKGTPSSTINLPSVDSETIPSGNLLEGTLAPTYIIDDTYYGLVGNEFLLIESAEGDPDTDRIAPAGKAILPASVVDGNVKTLNFVFNDETGIREIRTISAENATEIFNLAGQRLQKPQRGVNIVNGRKVLVK